MTQDTHNLRLQRAQEVDDVLLFLSRERIEPLDDLIRFTSLASVSFDRLHEIRCSSVVEEKETLSHPQRGAVRNSSAPAPPCVIPSDSPFPMLWTRRSEYILTVFPLSAALGTVD